MCNIKTYFSISFPGGKVDFTDKDVAQTALRETLEEIGLPKSQVEVLGQLAQLPSKVRFLLEACRSACCFQTFSQ